MYMKLLNEIIRQLEDIESSLNQDNPPIPDIQVDVTLLLNLLHDEQAFNEEKFHQVPLL